MRSKDSEGENTEARKAKGKSDTYRYKFMWFTCLQTSCGSLRQSLYVEPPCWQTSGQVMRKLIWLA